MTEVDGTVANGAGYGAYAPLPGAAEGDSQTMAIMIALASELVVLRSRVDTLERILTERHILPLNAIEEYVGSVETERDREAMRTRVIRHVFGPVKATGLADLAAVKQEKRS